MSEACRQCARRDWLLAKLGVGLDFRARDLSRFWDLLELPDRELIDAVGGRRSSELHDAYARWKPERTGHQADVQTICRHRGAYPERLRDRDLAPRMLGVRGGIDRMREMLGGAVVAIVGSARATDYGMQSAHALARGLAASGVTVIGGFGEGIPRAVHTGALESRQGTLTVMAGGLRRCSPAWCEALYRRILDCGCAISETPLSSHAPRWGVRACARTLALLAEMVIVVEAGEDQHELACARIAQRLGRRVAAVPGRVSSPASRGANGLLMEGASLVRDPWDALDLLYGAGGHPDRELGAGLGPPLQRVLDRVGDGRDTLAKLTGHGSESSDDIALSLAELELQGLLVRGDGGRYVPAVADTRGTVPAGSPSRVRLTALDGPVRDSDSRHE
ncbi:MAG TPA: DNA-processing protein DprA [Solirubrobacteraceae bacterium]|jgi:DNA processing protein|nr:DNA-processing protein DprA [Solirubrobacteraceae bacterium]